MTLEHIKQVYLGQFEQINACLIIVHEEINEQFFAEKANILTQLQTIENLSMLTADELLQDILMRHRQSLQEEIISRLKWRLGLPD